MGATKRFNEIGNLEVLRKQIAMNLQAEIGKNVEYTNDLVFIIHNFIKMITNCEYQAIDPGTKQIITLNDVRGLYIAGGIGSGKSTLIKALTKTMHDLRISYQTNLFETTKYFFGSKCVYSITELNNIYSANGESPKNVSVVAIDDMPKDNLIFRYMGNSYSLDAFIQDRYDEAHTITFVTSNFPLSDKYLKLDPRSVSRLHEMCAYYELRNTDYRKKLC